MKANAEKVRQTRGRLAGELVSLGFKVYPSSTNFLWIRPPSKLPAASLFQRLREQSIVVRYFDGPRTKDYVRITVGTGEQTDALLNAIRLMVG